MTTLIETALLVYAAILIIPSYYCSNSFANPTHPDSTGPFSLDGRLFQNDYAIEAAKTGPTAIGISCNDGIILVAEKLIPSPLTISSSIKSIFKIDEHVGMAVSGLAADSRTLVAHAEIVCQYHSFLFNEPIQADFFTQSVCGFAFGPGEMHRNGDRKNRPLGVAVLIALWDRNNVAQLLHADPVGEYSRFESIAIGVGFDVANCYMAEQYRKEMTMDEAKTFALKSLQRVMKEKFSPNCIEVSFVTKDGYCTLNENEISQLVQQLDFE